MLRRTFVTRLAAAGGFLALPAGISAQTYPRAGTTTSTGAMMTRTIATTSVTKTAHTLKVPGATLYYEVRGTGVLLCCLSSGSGERSRWSVEHALGQHRMQDVDATSGKAEDGLVVALALRALAVVVGARRRMTAGWRTLPGTGRS